MIRILLSTRLGELRLKQAELARMTDIRGTTINQLYNEIAQRISFEHLDLLCEALECDVSDILVYVPNSEPKIKSRRGTPLHKER